MTENKGCVPSGEFLERRLKKEKKEKRAGDEKKNNEKITLCHH